MDNGRYAKTLASAQRGLTLIELMVALVIGLFVTLGAFQLFISGKRSFDRVEALAERQETLRFLVDTLSLDIRTADRDGMTISGDDDILTLTYTGTRKEDPHCSMGEALTRVEYAFEEATATVKVGYDCDNHPKGTQPLVSGVEKIIFPAGGGGLSFVDVDIRFPAIGGEDEMQRTIRFRVANRNAVIQ
ncbi:hypothetical protein GCM10007160_34360 [Litchfieldella qijiaojingensis]|uniref:Prepilin-type N-terminal cleavage/methylation domain-containing protein n=1 Tax=Litchfieldella qijiaojingensis TaxID=980347 RepID=A0ABQ2Z3C8_9GAMM|nr:prepilin-type N-terminal cleavage/methylation domain-containing protein [Halomonas qijiaojingensis]GGY03698.1 hypothetical protein GCM10007160_34360 [Halomonas qijiaojingensis]